MRPVPLLLIMIIVGACGGGSGPTSTPSRPTGGPTAGATSAPATSLTGGLPSAAELCGLLTAADWGAFNYVTAAQPDVTSDAPGTAICTFANGLYLETYVDETAEDAEETFQTILENAPFDGSASITIPGADEVQLDNEISAGSAGIAVRAGRVSFTIDLPAGDAAQTQLTALATLVLQRVANLT